MSVYRMCKDGRLPGTVVNDQWLVDSQAVPEQYRPVARVPSRQVARIPEGYVSLREFAAMHGVSYHTVVVWLLLGRIDAEPLRVPGNQTFYIPATTPVKATLLAPIEDEEAPCGK